MTLSILRRLSIRNQTLKHWVFSASPCSGIDVISEIDEIFRKLQASGILYRLGHEILFQILSKPRQKHSTPSVNASIIRGNKSVSCQRNRLN
jgi:hypothetical protein